MLDTLRKGAGGFVAKIFFAILMGSFALWGIGDILRTRGTTTLAQVGSEHITPDEFRQSYTKQIQDISRRLKRPISPDEAKTFGLDQLVLSQIINERSLNQEGKKLGLAISAQTIAEMVTQSKAFQGPGGAFNRLAFEDALRNASLTEAGFLASEKDNQVRRLLLGALSSEIKVPELFVQNAMKYQYEERTIVLLETSPLVKAVPEPTAEQLDAYFIKHKASFGIPETRAITLLEISPEILSEKTIISDADIKSTFDDRKVDFSSPEKRQLYQIVLPAKETADQFLLNFKSGKSFEDLAQQLGKSLEDINLGNITQAQMADANVAKIAFETPKGQISTPVQSAFGTTLVYVKDITAAEDKNFDSVKNIIKADLQKRKAQDLLLSLYDKIEDSRAGGSTLNEIAQKENLKVIEVAQLLRNGSTLNKQAFNHSKLQEIAQLAFTTAPGVETSAISLNNGGYIWVDVKSIVKAAERDLEAAKPEVIAAWKKQELKSAQEAKAADLMQQAKSGKSLEQIAQANGLKVETLKNATRSTKQTLLSEQGLQSAFSLPENGLSNVQNTQKTQTVIAQVLKIDASKIASLTEQAKLTSQDIGNALADDLGNAYAQSLQKRQGITINNTLLQQAIGSQ